MLYVSKTELDLLKKEYRIRLHDQKMFIVLRHPIIGDMLILATVR